MDRDKEILEWMEPYFKEQFDKSCNEIHIKCMEKPVEFCEAILMSVSTLFKRAAALQEADEKDAISCLYINHLQSSVMTGTWEFRLDLYDKDFWMDDNPVTEYLTIPNMSGYFIQDMAVLEGLLKKQFIRLTADELDTIQMEYAHYYFSLGLQILKTFVEPIHLFSVDIQKEADWKIYYGEYFDSFVELNDREKEYEILHGTGE